MKCKICNGTGRDNANPKGCWSCKGSGSIVRKPIGFLEKLTCYLIKKTLQNSINGAWHSPWIMVIMKTIKNEMDKYFIEDNEPSRITHMVELVVKASDMEEDWEIYKKLKEITG